MSSSQELSMEPVFGRTRKLKRDVYAFVLLTAFCMHASAGVVCPKGQTDRLGEIIVKVPVSPNGIGINDEKAIENVGPSHNLRWWNGLDLGGFNFPTFQLDDASPKDEVKACLERDGHVLHCVDINRAESYSLRRVFYPSLNLTNTNMSGAYRLVATTKCSRSNGIAAAASLQLFNLSVYDKARITTFRKHYKFQASENGQDGLVRCCANYQHGPEPLITITMMTANGSTSHGSFPTKPHPNEICANYPVLANEIAEGSLSNATCIAQTKLPWISSNQFYDQRLTGNQSCVRSDKRSAKITTVPVQEPVMPPKCTPPVQTPTLRPSIASQGSGGTQTGVDVSLPVVFSLTSLLLAFIDPRTYQIW